MNNSNHVIFLFLVHKQKHHFTVNENEKKEQRETFVFDTSMNFPPSVPLPAPLPQYAWYDTLFSIKYGLYLFYFEER